MVMDPPPIRQIGWSEHGNYTRDPRRLPAAVDNPWRPCPTCWGSGRVYEMNLYEHVTCWTCLGVASVPSKEDM